MCFAANLVHLAQSCCFFGWYPNYSWDLSGPCLVYLGCAPLLLHPKGPASDKQEMGCNSRSERARELVANWAATDRHLRTPGQRHEHKDYTGPHTRIDVDRTSLEEPYGSALLGPTLLHLDSSHRSLRPEP